MNDRKPDEERIFHVARAIADDQPRNEYLDQICSGDQGLRERVEALLRTHEREESFLASNNAVAETADHAPIRETAGQQIGRYKLLQKIGEGGFGVVFMAEQQRPVKRKVALKIIKPGMDTREVVARFEAERQALAMMDHTNIARVLDGGATESGRPFFVMELVKGVPITEYCDQNQLSTEERLQLFTTVCQAVQHAHQKGIIHRDLKPSNVLVTLADGQPVVKVIDFGVAKATNQQLTEKTLFTAFGQMVGTPQYMSPEQAEMSCLDVDTRSDVYSLGVLLYELLTGSTPLETQRLRTAGYAEMQRLIREEEPPKPSTRLSTSSSEQLTTIAKHRSISPDKLKREICGDLDWIVMKALEKDRNRRFDTPSELSQDVARYLGNEPVEARPPTIRYRAAKYLRRNRVALTMTSLIFLLLLAGLTSTWYQWNQALKAEADARSEKDKADSALAELRTVALENAIMKCFQSDDEDATMTAIRQAEQAGASKDWIYTLEGMLHYYSGKSEAAIPLFKKALKENDNNIEARALLAVAYLYSGNDPEYQEQIERLSKDIAFSPREKLFKGYAFAIHDPSSAVELIRPAIQEIRSPNYLLLLGETYAFLGQVTKNREHIDQAIKYLDQAAFFFEQTPSVPAFVAVAHHAASKLAMDDNQVEAAEDHWRRSQKSLQELEQHREYTLGVGIVAWTYQDKAFHGSLNPDRMLPENSLSTYRDKSKLAWQELVKNQRGQVWPIYLAAHHLTFESDHRKCREEFEKHYHNPSNPYSNVALWWLYLANDNLDESQAANLKDLIRDPDQPIQIRYQAFDLFCLTLKVEDIQALAKEFLEQKNDPLLSGWGGDLSMKYFAGQLGNGEQADDEFIKRTAEKEDYSLCGAYFRISLFKLAEGKRTEAKRYLEKSVETHATGMFEYSLAMAAYSLLADEKGEEVPWPHWIPSTEKSVR